MSDRELVEEALAAFRRAWATQYPEKGQRRRQILDVTLLQELWNRYARINVRYHGQYVPASDPNFLK
jgi:hypothetical protein